MKSWFAKFRISTALDAGKPLPESLRQRIACSEELRRFAEGIGALDRALKETPPKSGAPPVLHGSILSALRAAECTYLASAGPRGSSAGFQPAVSPTSSRQSPQAGRGVGVSERYPMLRRWLPVTAVGALALAAAWWALHRPVTSPEPQPLDTAGQALEMANQVTRAMPSAMVAPMTKELEGLNRDLDSTARFLLASLP